MGNTDKRKRIEELTAVLSEAARVYEQEDREIMSNFEYDALYDELLALEKETGIVLAGSPTHKVGFEVLSDLPKERHPSPMLSLDKTKSREALSEWLGDAEGVLSWKMDGLTVVLSYENGELVKAVTRGNGEIGEVITNNAKVFKNVPVSIPYRGSLVLRGEAVIRYSDFEKINARISDIEAKYKNPRNLCSGSVRQLNNRITAERNVYLYAFALITGPDGLPTYMSRMDFLDKQGFTTVERKPVRAGNVADTVGEFESAIASNDFPSDGLVLMYNDIAYGESLGRTAKFPRNAIAFKWADEQQETTLLDIEWSASRTGLINPVAIFEPVELEGTTVSRASIHNVSIMEDLKLGIGDRITVYKANMIIPQIAKNLTETGPAEVPAECPVCGEKTYIKNENGVKTLFCGNSVCPAKMVKKLALAAGRESLNIDGMSEATIEKLIGIGAVKETADLFRLSEHRDRIVAMEGFGEKSYENLLNAAKAASETTLPRVMTSLGIPGIGTANAKLLCAAFDNSIERIKNASVEELTCVPQIGDVLGRAVNDYFKDAENNKKLDELLSCVTIKTAAASDGEGGSELAGRTFVITGSVFEFKNRGELKSFIEEHGGKTADSVSKNTDYLINNDSTSGSSKNKKAKELGVRIITEAEFLELAGR